MILIDLQNMMKRHWAIASNYAFEQFKYDLKHSIRDDATNEEHKACVSGFMTMVFNEILFFKTKYGKDYGKIVICDDSANPWRKQVSSIYKANRKEKAYDKFHDITWKHYHGTASRVHKQLSATPMVVMTQIYNTAGFGAEADDVIGRLVLANPEQKHLIVSTDGDFFQLLNSNVKQYSPLLKKFKDTPTQKEKQEWMMECCLAGQSKDNIMSVVYETELSEDFMKWFEEKTGVAIDNTKFLEIRKKFGDKMEEYRIEKAMEDAELIASGKRKIKRNLTAYKKPNFGAVAAKKFQEKLDENFLENPVYKENFIRNCTLMDLKLIDAEIIKKIDERYSEQLNKVCDMNWVMDFMTFTGNFGLEKIQGREMEFGA